MVGTCSTAAERQCGFALLIVLWTLALIAFLVAHLTAAGRMEIHIAGNLEANAAAQEAADGAIYSAIFALSSSPPNGRLALGRSTLEPRIGRSQISLRVENESARINPNLASPALVAALLRVLGSDPEQAAILAAAIAEWVGKPAGSAFAMGMENEPTMVRGYRPPRSALESIDELSRVRGMSPSLMTALSPHLTLFGPANPDPAAADPAVAGALRLLGEQISAAAPAAPILSDMLTVRIHAAARGPGNALVTRTAVVRLDPSSAEGYAVLAWNNGDEPFE